MEKWMECALILGEEALQAGEVPVGCVFIFGDQVIAKGRNTVNETRNATRHAEMNCVDQTIEWCAETGQEPVLVFSKTHVVVTVEPCIMCAAALNSLKVSKITYGCSNDRFGGCVSVLDVASLLKMASPAITGGCYQDEAMKLLKDFYMGVNPNAPTPKSKKGRKASVPVSLYRQ